MTTEAVGRLVRAARASRGWSVETAAENAAVGHMTWRRLEAGDTVRPATYAALDDLFDLPSGTLLATTDGGNPATLAAKLNVALPNTEDPQHWAALAAALKARRDELFLAQTDLVRNGGPSHQIVRNFESGEPLQHRPATLRKFDRALQWKPGTTASILAGTAGADPAQWCLPAVADTPAAAGGGHEQVLVSGRALLHELYRHDYGVEGYATQQALVLLLSRLLTEPRGTT